MSSQTNVSPKQRSRNWIWPVAFIVIVGGAIYISGAHEDVGPHGEHIIRSDQEYNSVLSEARELSEKTLIAYDTGHPLSEQDLRNLREAAKRYEELSMFAPTKMAPYFGAGRCHLTLGEEQTAEVDFQQCIENMKNESNPQTFTEVASLGAEAQFFLAQCYILDQNYQGAKDEAELALGTRPNIPNYLYVKARAEVQLNELSDARTDLARAHTLDPTNTHVKGLMNLLAANMPEPDSPKTGTKPSGSPKQR